MTAHTARPRYGEGSQIVCDGLVRIYKVADLEVVALQGLDLLVESGEVVAIVGASGSGKSTLLNILGGLDVPSAGRAFVAGHDLTQMGRRERTRYRRVVVGMVWQQTARNLLPYLTAVENVELPMTLDGRTSRRGRAAELLALVGLEGRADHRPDRLSGGEQQRVAIAVALANQPEVLLADEPTGELDSATAREVFGLLRRVNRELGTTVVIVTHDALVSGQVPRTVAIRDGRTSTETVRRTVRGADGVSRLVEEEFAVLDRVGRLQLPRSYVEALGMAHRVRLYLEGDHVTIRPDATSDSTDADAGDRRATVPGPDGETEPAPVPLTQGVDVGPTAPAGEAVDVTPTAADASAPTSEMAPIAASPESDAAVPTAPPVSAPVVDAARATRTHGSAGNAAEGPAPDAAAAPTDPAPNLAARYGRPTGPEPPDAPLRRMPTDRAVPDEHRRYMRPRDEA